MCTVTYLPTTEGYIITHNRDEAPARSPHAIERSDIGGTPCLFPRDTGAGGAWVAAVQQGPTICLLNGAFVKHERTPPYRRSRGLILLDLLAQPDWPSFVSAYDLQNIEPFTLLFFDRSTASELRWDGARKHVQYLPATAPAFWCSATLYPPDMQVRREAVFQQWYARQKPPVSATAILNLHHTGSVGDPENDFVMNRGNRVRTVSITQVVVGSNTLMTYHDLLLGRSDAKFLPEIPA